MANVERTNSSSSIIDVLDRVLDKGIVIDAWVRLSLVGIDLLTVEARVVVASIDTYLKFSEAVGATSMVARPTAAGAAPSTAGSLAGPPQASRPPVASAHPVAQVPMPTLTDVAIGTVGRAPAGRRRKLPAPN